MFDMFNAFIYSQLQVSAADYTISDSVHSLSSIVIGSFGHALCLINFGGCTFDSEYMTGGSLFNYLHKYRRLLNLSEVLKFAIDVAKGMEYLHESNIIHRDLKTANLLMDTHQLPYENMTPLQAALGVRQGLRPEIPENTHPKLSDLMQRCWNAAPINRPPFSVIREELQELLREVQVNML
ncbi:hypothetical protein Cgig2_004859 [Carnegiea gigantea]|uniref:Protein kinase domain-containing protein n=1 Tax=Carnegiea gigantea TaxID=171969 RepID=A0A9Q1QQ29_9CARY|nr:hypothetical protein Cgig2_004859 [Carnegiea gigantea]